MAALRTLLSRNGEPSQRMRRIVVVAAFAAIPISVTALFVGGRAGWPHPIGLIFFVVVMLVVSVPLLALSEFRRNLIGRRHPDERERQRRDEAYRISYRIVEVAAILGMVAVANWRDDIARIASIDWGLLFFPLWGYLIFLPYAVFAWREPDAVD